MSTPRWTWAGKWALVVGAVTLQLALPGCAKLSEPPPQPTPISTPSASNRPIYTVKKGSIVQLVKASGRVVPTQEATLYFRQSGRLRQLYVDTNQQVKAGDVLAEQDTGSLQTEIDQAKTKLDIAQLELAQVLEKAGGDTSAIARARAAADKAESAYTKAQGDLATLKAGPSDADVSAAEQAVASAKAQYDKAQTDLARLKAGPAPDAVHSAELDLQKAKDQLWAKQISRDSTCGGGHGTSCSAANADVASAQTAVEQAQLALDEAKAPSKPDDVANAERSVASAKASLDAAQAKLAQVRTGPTAADVAAAEKAVESAKDSLDVAKAGYDEALAAGASGADFDTQLQRDQVELARSSLQALQDQLDQAQLKAPFDGVVTSTDGSPGANVEAFAPVVTISNPQSLAVDVTLPAQDFDRMQLGQPATIVLTAFPTEQIEGKVAYMPSLEAGADPQAPAERLTVHLAFTPPASHAIELGAIASVQIVTQRSDGALILPTAAIRTADARKYVYVLSPSGRQQEMDVEVGLTNDTDSEIVKGLEEGQKVVG